jgi:hypothetical protein
MKPEMLEAIGGITAFLLTLMVFSYLIGDNPLYRIAVHLFVGVAAGYTLVVLIQTVIRPRLISGVVDAALQATVDPLPLARLSVPLVLGLMLALKLSPGLAPFGNMAMAFMVGVGAAVAIGGAINGTILGQVQATWINPLQSTGLNVVLNLFNAGVIILGTILTLMYFFYSAQASPGGRTDRPIFLKPFARGGELFISVALSALYVGALAATFAIFVERIMFLYSFVIDFPNIITRLGL